MKRSKRFLFSAIAALLLLGGCATPAPAEYPWDILEERTLREEPDGKVHLALMEETLTSTGGTFLMVNDGDTQVVYGRNYSVQIEIDGIWHDIYGAWAFPADPFFLDPGEEVLRVFDWTNTYGPLPPGSYRAIVDYLYEENYKSYEVFTPFTIE